MTQSTHTVPQTNVIGPFSRWPQNVRRRRTGGLVAGFAAVAVFVHCGIPMIF